MGGEAHRHRDGGGSGALSLLLAAGSLGGKCVDGVGRAGMGRSKLENIMN